MFHLDQERRGRRLNTRIATGGLTAHDRTNSALSGREKTGAWALGQEGDLSDGDNRSGTSLEN